MSADDQEVLSNKYSCLMRLLRKTDSALVAFSGGVDSTFLLKVMKLAGIKIVAVTGQSETMPKKDKDDAERFSRELVIEHIIITTDELTDERFSANPADRCFYCKDGLFKKMREIARQENMSVIFDGTNADDLQDYRPGRKAAAAHGVRSPLAECGLTKDDIRALSKQIGLDSWNRPSSPCLASRIPYGTRITGESLKRIECAEEILSRLGVHTCRVRHYGDMAKIEAGEDDLMIILDPKNRQNIIAGFKALGYTYIALDLEGYRSGSLNLSLNEEATRSRSGKY